MDIRTFKYEYASLELDRKEIGKFMGYDGINPPEPIPELIEDVLLKAENYCNIQGGYRIFEKVTRDKRNHLITIDNITFHIKPIISNLIRKAEKAALFVCTAGAGIGEWSKELMSGGDLMKGYVVDVVGSEIVEKAMDKIQETLASDMQMLGLGITDRYSPGYCDWQVSEQQKLFTFFPENYCGIRLSKTSLMYPIKSVSGLIGIGKNAERKGYSCDFCRIKDCLYRKKRTQISC
jgi:hypothetical protein